MKRTMHDEIFLATTAKQEFWDLSKPILYLGEWCLLYHRQSYWKSLDAKLLSSPYDNIGAPETSYVYVNSIFEKLLPQLGVLLNSIHNENYSDRYWRILLGSWLQSYLSVVYDRYIHIKRALEQYPHLTTIGLSEKSFYVPIDSMDFQCSLLEDTYNLQLYTKVLKILGKECPCKQMEVSQNPLYAKLHSSSWRRKAFGYLVRLYIRAGAKLFKSVLLQNSYFSNKVELELICKNLGWILPSWSKSVSCSRFQVDNEKRNILRELDLGAGEFELCMIEMLSSEIPQCFIEGYGAVGMLAQKNYPKRTNAILSANAWYYDEAFKIWAAKLSEEGVTLLGTQHGGIYGGFKYMPSEDYETSIVDRYYTWGWERSDCHAKVIPMPSTKLAGKSEIGADNWKVGILWASTASPRYVVQLPFIPAHFQAYLDWQLRFAKTLSQEMITITRFRPHRETYEWGIVERLKDCISDIHIDSWDVAFQDSLQNCRLYVCDHLQTTFAEALALNKPTVLFCNPETNRLRLEAQPYFDLLKTVGILFDTPEAAALAVATVYDDVEAWWNASERQQVVQKFCKQFVRTSPDAVTLWSEELRRVSDHSVHQG